MYTFIKEPVCDMTTVDNRQQTQAFLDSALRMRRRSNEGKGVGNFCFASYDRANDVFLFTHAQSTNYFLPAL
jgi:hypothetical protein